MEWLVRDVPGIGRGLSGGFMEYPWWFGTETYSLQALTATGDFELAKQTLRLLRDQSMKVNGNGRIVHEITTDGAVSNRGNTQETAQFVLTVGKVFEWTGDQEFCQRDVSRHEEGHRLASGRDGPEQEPVPRRLRNHGGLRLECGADRCRGIYAAGSGGHGAHCRSIERHGRRRAIHDGWPPT